MLNLSTDIRPSTLAVFALLAENIVNELIVFHVRRIVHVIFQMKTIAETREIGKKSEEIHFICLMVFFCYSDDNNIDEKSR